MLQNLLIAPLSIGLAFFWIKREHKAELNESSKLLQQVSQSHQIQFSEDNLAEQIETVEPNILTCRSMSKMLWDYTPKFVLGFIFVVILFNTTIPEDRRDNCFTQLFALSEWFSTLSFVSIGMGIRLFDLFEKLRETGLLICLYLITQSLDIVITGAIAYYFFEVILKYKYKINK